MAEVESRKMAEFPVAARVIWELIADFGGIARWWPRGMLARVEVEGEGVGMVRHMHAGGLVLSERLDALDPERMRIELSITGDLPGGVRGYRARGEVVPLGPERCRLDWAGRYSAPSREAEASARAFLEGAYEMQARGLLAFVTEGDPRSPADPTRPGGRRERR